MTTQDYELLATAIREALAVWPTDVKQRIGVQTVANRISKHLANDDPRFDRAKFLEACEL